MASGNFFYKFLFKLSLGWANSHVANSSYTAALLKKLCPKLQVRIIPYGSPIAFDKTALRKSKAPRRKLLFVGRHIERKGLAYLIEAMKLLPEDYSLTITGEGDLTKTLKKLAEGDSRIHFTGKLSAQGLSEAYSGHDIFVLPAIVDCRGDTEGLGVVLIEAIAAGLPIVASRVGGIPDIIENGKTGLLVEERSPQALAQAILKLGVDEKLCTDLVCAARAHAQEKFSWEKVAKQTLELYRTNA
jgi:glycosyltransferase involved in cell wall biosynthesis